MTFYHALTEDATQRTAVVRMPTFPQLRTIGRTAGRFILHFVEMCIANPAHFVAVI